MPISRPMAPNNAPFWPLQPTYSYTNYLRKTCYREHHRLLLEGGQLGFSLFDGLALEQSNIYLGPQQAELFSCVLVPQIVQEILNVQCSFW